MDFAPANQIKYVAKHNYLPNSKGGVARVEETLTLHDLVGDPALGLSVADGSEATLLVPVTWAHTTERVDPRPHVRAHELVCTVGTALLTPHDSVRFAQAVHDSGASGICIGLGEVHTKPPRALVRESQRLGLPLLEMRHGVPFLAINDAVVLSSTVSRDKGEVSSPVLTELLDAVRAERTTSEILALASSLLGGDFVRESDNSTSRDEGAHQIAIALDSGGSLVWRNGDPSESSVVEQVAGIVLIAERAAREKVSAVRQRRGELVTLVGDGLAHASALSRELHAAGVSESDIIVSAWPSGTADVVAPLFGDSMVAEVRSMVFLVTHEVQRIRDAAEMLGLVCGYSSAVGANDVERAINEARAALALARSRGSVAGPQDLTSLDALLEQQPIGRLEPFVEHLVQPLVDADARRNSDLVSTLRSFLEHGSVKETASAGFLHVNTVRHRLGRIARLSGRDPLREADLVDLRIALWAFDRTTRRQGLTPRSHG